ncbi:ribonuclease HII [Cognatishimia sp. F0-27]|uniref:ribonuclease HII n=1 Tax=Cognatishimia sp. F0-27 TaxID=2816855 RepID=UPI001D0C1F0F|nr:ribonuclease HII [Cognatishimia sp. F0-27]MCC1494676.1 ribonuclease HII [Cognatishimia sp. F0-27]
MDALQTKLEAPHWAAGRVVAGVDEVGRGPLAGPVVAAAVILREDRIPVGLQDSKKLGAARREALTLQIAQAGLIGIGQASVEEIDRINILQATYLAMQRAVAALPQVPDHLLVDGNRLPRDLPCPASAVVRGDSLSPSIAAASIVAKTWRDNVMKKIAQHHPGYGWETNAGYPTPCHKKALRDLGVTPHHRRSFKPVHNILYQE